MFVCMYGFELFDHRSVKHRKMNYMKPCYATCSTKFPACVTRFELFYLCPLSVFIIRAIKPSCKTALQQSSNLGKQLHRLDCLLANHITRRWALQAHSARAFGSPYRSSSMAMLSTHYRPQNATPGCQVVGRCRLLQRAPQTRVVCIGMWSPSKLATRSMPSKNIPQEEIKRMAYGTEGALY